MENNILGKETAINTNNEFEELLEKKYPNPKERMSILQIEYQNATEFEMHYTNLRWTVYTTLTTLSLAIVGYVLSTINSMHNNIRVGTLFFAWFIQFFATFFYLWFHKIGHNLREYLINLENVLGFQKYTIRAKRPFGKFKFHSIIIALNIIILAAMILFALAIL